MKIAEAAIGVCIRAVSVIFLVMFLAVPVSAFARTGAKPESVASAKISSEILLQRIVKLLSAQRAEPGFKGVSVASWNRLSDRALVRTPNRPGVLRIDAQVREGWSYWIESREQPDGGNVAGFYIRGDADGKAPRYCTFRFTDLADRLKRNGFDYSGPQRPPSSSRVHFFSRPHFPVVVITYLPAGSASGESCVESIQVEPSEYENG